MSRRKGEMVSDWRPGRVTQAYRDNYDATFRRPPEKKGLTNESPCGRMSKKLKGD